MIDEPQIHRVEIHRPDTWEKLSFFFSGIVMSIPLTLFFEELAVDYLITIMPRVYASLLLITVIGPIIEEYSKIFPLFHRHAETERSLFILAFLIGLGFGVSEFFVYVVGRGVPVLMRLPAMFFHAASTSITAYGITKRHFLRFFSLAISLHIINNFLAELGAIWYIGGIAVNIIIYYLSWRFYNATSETLVIPAA